MTPADVRIVSPVPADAAALLGLHRHIVAEGEWFVTEPDELRSDVAQKVQLIRDSARSENSLLRVARRGPLVVGVVQVSGGVLRRTRHVGRLEVMVAPEARGLGIGHALLAAAVHWAEENPVLHKIALQVYAHNTRARAMYAEAGFVEEGLRRREYRFPDGSWRDEVLMARWVKPQDP